MGMFVTVDIGGTHIRAAAYAQTGTQPRVIRKIRTKSEEASPFDRLVGLIRAVSPDDEDVLSITVAAPGAVDPATGVIAAAPNIEGWHNFPLRDRLAAEFQLPAYVGNDANLAALGEWRYGAGQGHSHLLYLTISTGIGAGVILNNQVVLGAHGLAAELGHVTVLPDGPLCGCGQRGHLEALAAGPAISAYVQDQIAHGVETSMRAYPELSARSVDEAARAGDALAIQAIARSGRYLGMALADFLAIFNPSIVIFGGGVSLSGDLLLGPLKEALRARVLDPVYLQDLAITTAALGDDAGLLGALAYAHGKQERVGAGL
jgi:glucokinase